MSAIEGKYGIITAEKKQFHPGEPVFLLRATDPLAADAVEDYASRCVAARCENDHVVAVFQHADRIRKWQQENPSLVKKLPD